MKAEPANSKQGGPGAEGARRWLRPAALAALVVLGGGAFYYLYRDEPPVVEDKTPRAASLAPRNFLPARARAPRPRSLDPKTFSDLEVRQSYEVAQNHPELLEQMPCYCGCYGTSGHSSNYDCFVDSHGAT